MAEPSRILCLAKLITRRQAGGVFILLPPDRLASPRVASLPEPVFVCLLVPVPPRPSSSSLPPTASAATYAGHLAGADYTANVRYPTVTFIICTVYQT